MSPLTEAHQDDYGTPSLSARFRHHTAIVTGATSPVGSILCRALLEEGANVVAIDDREPTFDGLSAPEAARCLAFAADVTDDADVAAVLSELTPGWPVRHLFNIAETQPAGTIAQTTPHRWDRVFAINIRATFLLCRHVLPVMAARGGGTIVNVAPQPADEQMADGVAYWASKGAVIGLTRAMAADHAADGVRINYVCPAVRPPDSPTRSARATALAALYLASDDAAPLTGGSTSVAS